MNMDLISLILSILALSFSVFIYFYHDRKIKKQEKLLNDYNIRKNEQEEIENKKACIRANMIKLNGGKYAMKIYISGKAEAKNINVQFMDKLKGFYTTENKYSYKQILPHDGTEFILLATEGHEDSIGLRLSWDDAYKVANEFVQNVNVPKH